MKTPRRNPVRAWLTVHGLSVRWLSDETGIPEQRVHGFIHERNSLKPEEHREIAKAIHKPVGYVTGPRKQLAVMS